MSEAQFSIGNDLLDLMNDLDAEVQWSVAEWAADFYKRNERAAHIEDFMRERPGVFVVDKRKGGKK